MQSITSGQQLEVIESGDASSSNNDKYGLINQSRSSGTSDRLSMDFSSKRNSEKMGEGMEFNNSSRDLKTKPADMI